MFTPQPAPVAGKKGGQMTVQRHGAQHMAAIGKKGFAATVAKHWRGERVRYLRFLQTKGLVAIDPFSTNGAWQRPVPTPDEPYAERLRLRDRRSACRAPVARNCIGCEPVASGDT